MTPLGGLIYLPRKKEKPKNEVLIHPTRSDLGPKATPRSSTLISKWDLISDLLATLMFVF